MKFHPPLTEGHLEVTGPMKLMASAHVRRVTGTLKLRRQRCIKEIYFHEGRLAGAGSNQPSESLGTFMVCHGFISTEAYAQSLVLMDRSEEKHGKILVSMGAVTQARLEEALRLQHLSRLGDAASWTRGSYSFAPAAPAPRENFSVWLTFQTAVFQRLGRVRLLESARANQHKRVVTSRSVLDPYLVHVPPLFTIIGYGDGRYTVAELARQQKNPMLGYVNLLVLKELGVLRFENAADAAAAPRPPARNVVRRIAA